MLLILSSGGTIEGLEYQNEDDSPNFVIPKIKDFIDAANISFTYTMENVFHKDSRFITQKDRELLADKIKSAKQEKVLITHGTVTMVETAKFLGKLQLNKKIVLVGSFILGTAENSDAQFNLGFALCSLKFLENGVYIAMNGEIFSWDNVVKNKEKNRFECLS